MTTVADVLLWMVDQIGAEYVFGAEVSSPPPPRVHALDCSEYVQAGCDAAGVRPPMPDGAYYQWRHTLNHRTGCTVAEGLRTWGALLFAGSLRGAGRDAVHHVAVSLGDGRTLEARGRQWRVGIFDRADSRSWSAAGRIPGVTYHPGGNPMAEAKDLLALLAADAAMRAMLNRAPDDAGLIHWARRFRDEPLDKVLSALAGTPEARAR